MVLLFGAATCMLAQAQPRIQFAELVHEFGKVLVSVPQRHDFIFTNTGNAVLEITGVRAG